MTIEEKARGYEKKDFRKLYEDLVKSDWFKRAYHDKSLGECPFDIRELAESEDERIIRAIDEAIKDAHVNTLEEYGSSCKEARAWLKTQLEKQKPATFYVPDDADLSHPRNKLAFMLGQYRKQGHINEEEYWQMLKYLIEKEPKSSQTDTEKEYVRTLKSLISDFLHGKQEIDTEYYQQIYDWLDEIHIEQKVLPGFDGLTPEEKMNHPLYLEGFDVGRDVQKVFDEQKPEWSEEDEDNLRRVTRIIEDNDSDWKELTAWLKSLRPQSHWKPSEEQMEAVQYVSQFDYGGHKATLVSLYEQLKKL